MSVDDWDRREVCPDGGCIGVIGPDGQCKVCGRAAPNWGDERKRGLAEPEDEDEDDEEGAEAADAEYEDDDEYEDDEDGDEEDDEDADYEDEDEAAAAADADDGSDPEWSKRQLCSDGACVGVIGSDNKCTVCGKAP